MSAKDFILGEAHYFEETVTPEKIKHLLDNVESSSSSKSGIGEKTEGMKYLLAMMAKGRDVSEFYPDVVRNVIVKAVEVKKLVYTYLVHHADANATCRELALLAINSFQRDLSDSNQLIRGLALRVLCGIRVREIVQIQIMSVKKCASDSSPYVRKSAAHSLGKIFQIDPDTKGELVEMVDRLLGDKTTAVLSSAIAAFNEVCPENLPLLHPHYRKLCALLADFDEWGQIAALGTLTRYARTQFTNPEPEAKAKKPSAAKKKAPAKREAKKGGKKKSGFYSSEEEEESSEEEEEDSEGSTDDDDLVPKLQDDHALLLRVCLPLLRSRNSGVVLAVAALHHYVGPRDRAVLGRIGRALVRVMRGHREVTYVVLTNCVEFARAQPDMFRRYLKDFFIAESEPAFVRRMKLDVLTALASPDSVGAILAEFGRYVKDDDKAFVKAAIQAIVKIANALPEVADRCLRGLMALVGTDNDAVVAEAVIAIRQLLQQHPQHDSIIVRLARKLGTTASPSARAAIVWILGEFQDKPRVASMAPDALRLLAKGFRGEAAEVKMQILNLAAKTALRQGEASKPVALLLRYVLELARYDGDYDLRDRARVLRHLLLSTADITAEAADAVEEVGAVIAVGAGTAAGVRGLRSESGVGEGGDLSAAEAAVAASAAAAAEEGAAAAGEAGEAAPAAGAGGAEATAEEGAAAAGAGAAAAAPSPASGAGASTPGGAGATPAPATPAVRLQDRVRAVVLAAKPPPAVESALAAGGAPAHMLGSLSFMVGHAARGYQPLPEWAPEESAASVRDPPRDEDDEPRRKKRGAFAAAYVSSSEEESEEGSEEESSEEEETEEEDDEDEDETDEDDSDEEEAAPAAKAARAAAPAGKRVVAGEDDEDEDEDEDDDDEDEDDESDDE